MIPLVSFIEPANVYEGKLLSLMIQKTQEELSLHIDAVVGDMGYISADQKRHLRKQWQTTVLTKIRENMSPRKNILIMAAPNVRRDFPSLGMATIRIGRNIDISPLLITLHAAVAVSKEIATKKLISARPLMNTTSE